MYSRISPERGYDPQRFHNHIGNAYAPWLVLLRAYGTVFEPTTEIPPSVLGLRQEHSLRKGGLKGVEHDQHKRKCERPFLMVLVIPP